MAKINSNYELNVTLLSRLVTEISVVYNNRFIRKLYIGMTYKDAINQFKAHLKTL